MASLIWYKFLPAHFGGQKVIDSFNKLLSAEFDFIAIASKNNVTETNIPYSLLNILPTSPLQIINPIVWIQILKTLKKNQITHVVLEHPYHVITAQLAKWFLGVKIIYHVHNIEFVRFKKLNNPKYIVIELLEKWLFKISLLSIFITKEDLDYAITHKLISNNKVFFLPYFIQAKDVSKKQIIQEKIKAQFEIKKKTKILFFNGTLDYKPNAEALENIFDEVVPRLNSQNVDFIFLISGRIENENSQYLRKYFNKQIHYLGNVENVDDYFTAADVYVNPVQIGEGVQTKTLEALSYQLPVVCFNYMLPGIEINLCNHNLYIADTWDSFSQKITEAMNFNKNISQDFFDFYNLHNYSSSLKKSIESL